MKISNRFSLEFKKYKYIYLLLLPMVLYLILFKYKPMYGLILSFKKFNFSLGIFKSHFIGFDNFRDVFRNPMFWTAFKNTLIISFMQLLISFPIPIVIALLINEVRNNKQKRILQTIYTFPHFLSWIIISGMLLNFFGSGGVLNVILSGLGLEKISILTNKDTFRIFLVLTESWKEAGWGTIIYLAAISGIDPQLYEAAELDGAGRWGKMRHITFASILSTIIVLFILKLGTIMQAGGAGFNQIVNLYNPVVYDVADIIDTFIYRRTFDGGITYGVSTAVGLFKSLINFILLFSGNMAIRKMTNGERGMF